MGRPEFHGLAERELNEAAQYYDLEDPGLGTASLRRSIAASSPSRLSPKPERFFVGWFVVGFSGDFRTRSCTGFEPRGIRILAVMNLKRWPTYRVGRE